LEIEMPDKHENKITLIFIINGQDVPIETNVNSPLKHAVEQALKASGNTGRPLEEWETRDAAGVLLETERKVKDLDLRDGSRLFLSLRVGAGGVSAARS
jgi:hypothetical protein